VLLVDAWANWTGVNIGISFMTVIERFFN